MTTKVTVLNGGPDNIEVHRVSADDLTESIVRNGEPVGLQPGENHEFYVHSHQILMIGEKA